MSTKNEKFRAAFQVAFDICIYRPVLGAQHEYRTSKMTVMSLKGTNKDDETGINYVPMYYGAHTYSVHPDDVEFALKYHGSGNSSWDWAASSWKKDTNKGESVPTMADELVSFDYSIGNRGTRGNTSDNKLRVDFVLSDNSNISLGDQIVETKYIWEDMGGPGKGDFKTYEESFVVPYDMAPGSTLWYMGVVLDREDEFDEWEENGENGNNRTYLASRLEVNDCTWHNVTSSPINTITYHEFDYNHWMNYRVEDFPWWTPEHIVVQVQPIDDETLDGVVVVNGEVFELSGWYTDLRVEFTGEPIVFRIHPATEKPRQIRLEWWAEADDWVPAWGGPDDPIDPNCDVQLDDGLYCTPIKTENNAVEIPIEHYGDAWARLSGFPSSWIPTDIAISFVNSNSFELPSGTVEAYTSNGMVSFNIESTQWYQQIQVPYSREGNIDLKFKDIVFSPGMDMGLEVQWWPVSM